MEIPPERGYPKIITLLTSTGFQIAFTLLALALIIFYNAAYFLFVPVTGVWLDYTDQQQNSAIISSLDPGGPGEKAGLRVGDKILTIDGKAITNLNVPVHQPKTPGEIEQYVIQRDHQTITIPVLVGSYLNHLDYLANIVPVQLLSLLMCLLGLVLLFFSPVSDVRGRLIAHGVGIGRSSFNCYRSRLFQLCLVCTQCSHAHFCRCHLYRYSRSLIFSCTFIFRPHP